MRKTIFANGELYHIYNRGVEKRKIFLDDQDYFRAVHALYVFNDEESHVHLTRSINVRGRTSTILEIHRHIQKKKREKLVEIVAFCLMPNHYHFLLKQVREGGISKFMQKFGTGYTMYFNERYDRSGVLFQGKFKSVFVGKEKYFSNLLNYIHLNPVDLVEQNWKEDGIKDWPKVRKFLKDYRWSSYKDYIGLKNFPSVIGGEALDKYSDYTARWLQDDLESIENLVLE